jgi:hypothetical protein
MMQFVDPTPRSSKRCCKPDIDGFVDAFGTRFVKNPVTVFRERLELGVGISLYLLMTFRNRDGGRTE